MKVAIAALLLLQSTTRVLGNLDNFGTIISDIVTGFENDLLNDLGLGLPCGTAADCDFWQSCVAGPIASGQGECTARDCESSTQCPGDSTCNTGTNKCEPPMRRMRRALSAAHFAYILEPLNDYNNKNSKQDPFAEEEHRQMLVDQCGDQDYDLALFVAGHMAVVSMPSDPSLSEICPTIAIHSKTTKDNDEDNKKVLTKHMDRVIDLELLQDGVVDKHMRNFGTRTFTEIVQAFDDAEPSLEEGGGIYDMVYNNCGAMPANFGKLLGITPDDEDVKFIAKALIETVNENHLKESPFLSSLFGGLVSQATIESTMEGLVRRYI